MLFFRRVLVGHQERMLLIRNGRFVRVLGPGAHIIWNFGGVLEFERHDVGEVVFDGSWATYLAKVHPDLTEQHFITVETNDRQVAVISLDGKVVRVLSPGARALFWRGPVEVSVEIFDVAVSPEVPDRLVPDLIRVGYAQSLTLAVVEKGRAGLLSLDGRFVRTLGPGTHAFWNGVCTPRIELVDVRLQILENTASNSCPTTRCQSV